MSLTPGLRLSSRYEIVASLGAGGMGEVYKARDLRLGRDVAVKVLPEHLAKDSSALSRFEREGKAVAALSHPNILAIYDFGSDNGVSFAVMELLEGETLRDRIKASPLPWRSACEVALSIAEGLSAAHSKGVIHRDLKPENIFLTSDGQVKILDFGLAQWKAKALAQELSTAPTDSYISQTGGVMGTVPYMSPEQVRGNAIDARSDIFSFGSMLCEMLTGTRAFARTSAAETMAAILKEEPNEIDQLQGKIPVELQRLITHCLEKNPDQRFQTARDLGFDLKAILSGSALVLPERRLGFRALWAIPVLLLVAFIGTSIYFLQGAAPIHSLAILPFINGSQDPDTEYLSDGITGSIINSISQVSNLRVIAAGSVLNYKGPNMDPQKIGKELRVEAVVTGRVLRQRDTLIIRADLIKVADGSQLWGEEFRRSFAEIFAIQDEISKEIAATLLLKLTGEQAKRLAKRYTEDTEAYQLYLKARHLQLKEFSQEDFEKAIDYFKQAIQKDPNYALAHAGLSDVYSSMAFAGLLKPKEGYENARAAAQKGLELDDTLPETRISHAIIKWGYDWNWSAGLAESQKAIELNPNSSIARFFYAQCLRALGRFDEAISELKRAETLDPLSIDIKRALGATYYWAKRYDEAIKELREALVLDPNAATIYDSLADIYARKQVYKEALVAEERFLSIAGDLEGAATLRQDYEKSNYREAKELQLLKTLVAYQEAAKEQYVSPISFAVLYSLLNKKDDAFVWLERAYEERSPWLTNLKTDPQFENLRSDPRFKDLLKRIGLPQ